QLTNLIDSLSNKTTFLYDAVGHKTAEVDALGHTATYDFDAAGQMTQSTDRLGRYITFAYDGVGRELGETWHRANTSVADILTFTYDEAANLLPAVNGTSAYTMQYDDAGRMTYVQEPFAAYLNMAYDEVGNRTQVTDSFGGTEDSVYDELNRLTIRMYLVAD